MITALLAIDVGGSTSRATLVDMEGNCLGQGRNRGGNPGSNPPELAAAAVIAAARGAVEQTAADLDIKVALLAMAGPRNAEMHRLMEEAFRTMGLSGPLVTTGDTHAMLPAVTAALEGYCIFAGTGSGAVRFRGGEIDGVIDAAGFLLGDLGSGYWLGHQAAIAVAAALEGRGPETALTKALLDAAGVEMTAKLGQDGRPVALQDFIHSVYAVRPIELAKYAPMVLANSSDPVAAALIAQSVAFLTADLEKIYDPKMPGTVVLGGSVAMNLPALPDAVAEIVRAAGHEPDIRMSGDPSVGAAVLALRHQGITVDEAMLKHVASSMAARAKALA
jgi:glucosamine kinase